MNNLEKYYVELVKCLDTCKLRKFIFKQKTGIELESCVGSVCDQCKNYCNEWLMQEYKEPILDEVEKEYLSDVIRPFKKDIVWIAKCYANDLEAYFIKIYYSNNIAGHYTNLPLFDDEDMYVGMVEGKKYSLKDLDL